MFDQELMRTAIIVVPKSLMENWVNEFKKWYEPVSLYYCILFYFIISIVELP